MGLSTRESAFREQERNAMESTITREFQQILTYLTICLPTELLWDHTLGALLYIYIEGNIWMFPSTIATKHSVNHPITVPVFFLVKVQLYNKS